MKRHYILTEQELERILNASKPTPVMYLSGGTPMFNSPQENANRAWKEVAKNHGFVWDTVESARSDNQRDILAEPIRPEPVIEEIDSATHPKQ